MEILPLFVIEAAKSREADTLFFQSFGESFIGKIGLQFQEKMQTRVLFQNGKPVSQRVILHDFNQLVPAAAAGLPGPVDMLFKMAPADKPGQGILLKGGHRAAVEAQFLLEPPHKEFRQNQIADPKG